MCIADALSGSQNPFRTIFILKSINYMACKIKSLYGEAEKQKKTATTIETAMIRRKKVKIIMQNEASVVRVDSIEPGDCFLKETVDADELYVMTDTPCVQGFLECVNLRTGVLFQIQEGTMVVSANAEVVVK